MADFKQIECLLDGNDSEVVIFNHMVLTFSGKRALVTGSYLILGFC